MKHPVFGTGVDTPLGKQDPSRAAEAARYVRQAMSHLIDRQTDYRHNTRWIRQPSDVKQQPSPKSPLDTTHHSDTMTVRRNLAKSLLAAAGYDTGVAPPAGDFLAAIRPIHCSHSCSSCDCSSRVVANEAQETNLKQLSLSFLFSITVRASYALASRLS